MSVIDSRLPGPKALTRSTPQLPPLAQSSTPTVVFPIGSHRSVKELSPFSSRRRVVFNDRGSIAAAWSKKLPGGAPSKALQTVRAHLSPVEDAMLHRHSTKLKEALDEAGQGTHYMKALSNIRHSRSVPAIHRHALESALASHIVRAKVELKKWQTGIVEINELRRDRNSEKLMERLDCWKFADDDPVVQGAREDLKLWRYIEEQMPAVLRKAVIDKNMEAIKSNLQQLTESGPADAEWSREARTLLRRYEIQSREIRSAMALRDIEQLESAMARWEFPEDQVIHDATAMLGRREEQLNSLKMAVAPEHIDGSQLVVAVDAWEFESDCAEFRAAEEALDQFLTEAGQLESMLQDNPEDLLQLRIALDAWSFAKKPESCEALQDVMALLHAFEENVRSAIASSDGYTLQSLLAKSGGGRALGESNEELIAEANSVIAVHSESSNRLLGLVRAAPNLEKNARVSIATACDAWAFAKNDPVYELGRAWSHCHELVAESSHVQLQNSANAGFEAPARAALERLQGRALMDDDDVVKEATGVIETAASAWKAAGALAFGITPSRLSSQSCDVRVAESIMREIEQAMAVPNRIDSQSVQEVRSLVAPPEAVLVLLQVIHCLLAGCSSWNTDGNYDTSWSSLQKMLSPKFREHLSEVPFFISIGIRGGVTGARVHDAHMRTGPYASQWSREGMSRMSKLCYHLFMFMEHILRYDQLMADRVGQPESNLHGPEEIAEMWADALQNLQQGLHGSQSLAAIFLACGGDSEKLSNSEKRARVLEENSRQRYLEAQEALYAISPVGGSCRVRETDGDVSLLQRMQILLSLFNAVDARELEGPGAQFLAKAANCFQSPKPSRKRTGQSSVITCFTHFLNDACSVIGMTGNGAQHKKSSIVFCEEKISPSRECETVQLPMYQVTTAIQLLSAAPYQGNVSSVLSEFTSVLDKFYNHFLPLYFIWMASAEALTDAEEAVQNASQAMKICHALPYGVRPLLIGPPPSISQILDQLALFGAQGIAAVAPHVEGLRRVSAEEVAHLLQSKDIDDKSLRSCLIDKLLSAFLQPLHSATTVLERLSNHLANPGAVPQQGAHTIYIYQLVVAIFRVLGRPNNDDIKFKEAKYRLQQPKFLANALKKWHPLRDGSVQQLQAAESILLRLWPVYRSGHFHDDPSQDMRHRILFTWGSLATSLAPMLPVAQALEPVHAAVRKACEKRKTLSKEMSAVEAEEAVWAGVRKELHRPDEPWWWLRLIGCPDPKSFYLQHGLAYEDIGASSKTQVVTGILEAPIDVVGRMAGAARFWAGTEKDSAKSMARCDKLHNRACSKGKSSFGASPPVGITTPSGKSGTHLDEDRGVEVSLRLMQDAYSCNFDSGKNVGSAGTFADASPSGGTYTQDDFFAETYTTDFDHGYGTGDLSLSREIGQPRDDGFEAGNLEDGNDYQEESVGHRGLEDSDAEESGGRTESEDDGFEASRRRDSEQDCFERDDRQPAYLYKTMSSFADDFEDYSDDEEDDY